MLRLEICASKINRDFSNYTILDAGCRTMDLKSLLKNFHKYYGSDLVASEGVLKINLNDRLPYDDNSFDIVTCLDVLEHLDNPHQALKELIRVAKYSVFISLPNMYHYSFRRRFLFGGGISGKYAFPIKPIIDRHRWIMSYDEAIDFIKANNPSCKVKHENLLTINGRFKNTIGRIENILAKIFPNLFVYGVFFEIKLKEI
jgi:SAM-dependent methyltransferase